MKKLLLFLMVLVAGMTLPLQAQNTYYEDVVYLKNGTIVKGAIIEQIPNVSLKIQTREENIFVYKMDEVEKITKELLQQKGKTQLGSQKQANEDVVCLKNSSIIKGIIIEQIPNVSLKIQTREGNIFVYKMDEVEKITKELLQQKGKTQLGSLLQTNQYSSFNKPKGYLGLIEVEGGFGFGEWAAGRFGISLINGYRAIPQFAFGFGIGTRIFFYNYYARQGEMRNTDYGMPFFLHLRSDLLSKKTSPYIALNFGYNLSFGGYFSGVLVEPSLGVSFNIADRSRLNIGLVFPINGLSYWEYRYNDYGYQESYRHVNSMGYGITLKVGFSF